jgi:hypothetical protein
MVPIAAFFAVGNNILRAVVLDATFRAYLNLNSCGGSGVVNLQLCQFGW